MHNPAQHSEGYREEEVTTEYHGSTRLQLFPDTSSAQLAKG